MKIITVCYGQEKEWTSRDKAIDYFAEAATSTEGSEQLRYITVMMKLVMGENYCTDK